MSAENHTIVVKETEQKAAPVESGRTGKLIGITAGHFSLQGRRSSNEDRCICVAHPEFNEAIGMVDQVVRGCFVVFDGHGGTECAEYMSTNLVRHLGLAYSKAKLEGNGTIEHKSAIRTAIINCEAETESTAGFSGCTCAMVFVEGEHVLIAHIGDSRAMLSYKGKAQDFGEDHKPTTPSEKERIESHGGVVAREDPELKKNEKELTCWEKCVNPKPICTSPFRMWPGGLAMSRALGDWEAKPALSNEPEMFESKLTPDHNFILVACDGCWDVMSNNTAVEFLNERGIKRPVDACDALCEKAFTRGSSDNISSLIALLEWSTDNEPKTGAEDATSVKSDDATTDTQPLLPSAVP